MMKYQLIVLIVLSFCILINCSQNTNLSRFKEEESFMSEASYGEMKLFLEGKTKYASLSKEVKLYYLEKEHYLLVLRELIPLLKKGLLSDEEFSQLLKESSIIHIKDLLKDNQTIPEELKHNYIENVDETDKVLTSKIKSDFIITDWIDYNHTRGYDFIFEGKENGFDIQITKSKDYPKVFWHIQLICSNILNTSNNSYTFTFDAYSTNSFSLDTAIQSHNDYRDYAFQNKKFTIISDGQWHTYQYSFRGNQDVDDLMLIFKPGLAPVNTFLQVKNISIKKEIKK